MKMRLVVFASFLLLALVEVQGSWNPYIRTCYKCKKRYTHEQCKNDGIQVCKSGYTSCGTYIETDKYGRTKITKGCVKPYNEGCLIQNNCKGGSPLEPYCWYCCHDDLCNAAQYPPPKPDPCKGSPCQNGGICQANGDKDFSCKCKPGWTGKLCQDRIDKPDPCKSNPCRNGGTCRSCFGRWNCDCPPRFTGLRCETRINPCRPNPCKNDGRCVPSGNAYQCRCGPKFEGKHCEKEKNPCGSNPCTNGGTCSSHNTGYTCSCRPGYTGNRCETATPCFRCPTQSGLYPDRYDCRKFYHCAHWVPYHKDCPANLHFNARLKVCDWPENAACTPLARDSAGRSRQDCEEGGGECLVDQSARETRSYSDNEKRNLAIDEPEEEAVPLDSDPFYNPMKEIGFTDTEDDVIVEERGVGDDDETASLVEDPFYNPMEELGFTGKQQKVIETREAKIEEILHEIDDVMQQVKSVEK